MFDHLIPLVCAGIGAAVATAVLVLGRDARLDALRAEYEAKLGNGYQIQARWDAQVQARLEVLEDDMRTAKLALSRQHRAIGVLRDGLDELQETHEALGEALVPFLAADAVTDSPRDDDVIPISGGRGA